MLQAVLYQELDNYGIGIAYSPMLELTNSEIENYTGFLTNKTNTFFEPFVETIYNDYILDDRANFALDKANRLYLYCNIGGDTENLDELPTCSVEGKEYEVIEIGKFLPQATQMEELGPGEVGFISASIKDVHEVKIGDTVTHAKNPTQDPFPGFKNVKPVVFCGLYPIDPNQYQDLRDAIEKLILNDSAITFEPESSAALGFGFRCGFLGLLHMEIVQERLEREFNLNLISTAPTVIYKIYKTDGTCVEVDNPADLPDPNNYTKIEEPYISATLILPSEYVGAVIQLLQQRRGWQTNMKFLSQSRVILEYMLPLMEVVMDFYDKLKSCSRGYASFDYEFAEYRESKLVKLDILINKEPVDALSIIVHRDQADYKGRELVEKMKEVIPRQMFEVAIQAAIKNE